jgi:hypothetical protein
VCLQCARLANQGRCQLQTGMQQTNWTYINAGPNIVIVNEHI